MKSDLCSANFHDEDLVLALTWAWCADGQEMSVFLFLLMMLIALHLRPKKQAGPRQEQTHPSEGGSCTCSVPAAKREGGGGGIDGDM